MSWNEEPGRDGPSELMVLVISSLEDYLLLDRMLGCPSFKLLGVRTCRDACDFLLQSFVPVVISDRNPAGRLLEAYPRRSGIIQIPGTTCGCVTTRGRAPLGGSPEPGGIRRVSEVVRRNRSESSGGLCRTQLEVVYNGRGR
jgi:hypothetical protein